MKRILTVLTISFLFIISNAQVTITVYPVDKAFSTGYISATEKVSDLAVRGFPNFFMFDLSSVPNHATITSIDYTFAIKYSSAPNLSILTNIFLIDINTIQSTFQTLKDTIDNAGYLVSSNNTFSGNYGGEVATKSLDNSAITAANNALLFQDWLSSTIKFDSYDWEIPGYNDADKPFLEITYTPGTPITAITISGAGDADFIDISGGSLQLSAAVEPANPTYDSILWSFTNPNDTNYATIDENGLLTASGTDNVTVQVRATAWDGSGIIQTFNVVLSNQTSEINNSKSKISVFPNPASDILSISNTSDNYDIILVNVLGKTVYSVNNVSGQQNINIELLNSGLYFVKITDSNSEYISKLMVK